MCLLTRNTGWSAGFVICKYFPPHTEDARFSSSEPFGLTQGHLNAIANGRPLPAEVDGEIERLSDQYQFFHWHLAFPEVFANGGFDCVLGNPPWERVKLQEKEWFAERNPEIANAPNTAARKHLIESLKKEDPALYRQFLEGSRQAEGESHILRHCGRYPFCGRGDINLYAVFAEVMRNLLNDQGRVGCVLPTGIATDDTTKFFFQDVMEKKSLASLFDFENKGIFFPGVHSSYKFCLFTSGRGLRPTSPAVDCVFFAHAIEDLHDTERRFTLRAEDIALLNPNTHTCPIFRSRRDAELTKAIYRRVPVLIREAKGNRLEENPWGIRFSTMFHMSNDSHLFRTREQMEAEDWRLEGNIFRKDSNEYFPLYEAKMIHHFDHRWATYAGLDIRELTLEEKQESNFSAVSRYWIEAREVYLRTADLPPALLSALRVCNRQLIILGLAHLLFGNWLLRSSGESADAAMKSLWPKWLEFLGEYSFAGSVAPIQLGLCGNNPACLKPLGPEYLPAEPRDEIKYNDRQCTAWYAADKRLVSIYLKFAARYAKLSFEVSRIPDEIAALHFAESILRKASPSWYLGWRDICRSTDERTVVGGVFPQSAVGNNLPVWTPSYSPSELLGSLLSSLACDFIARFKVGGTHLNFFIAEQISVPLPKILEIACSWSGDSASVRDWLLPRVLELTYTAWDLEPFAQDCGWNGPPFCWNEDRRFLLRCELDAAFFHLYLPAEVNGNWKPAEGETADDLAWLKANFPTPRDAVAYIMDTFPIMKRKDEVKWGAYRTKDTILEIYDAMTESIRSGQPYLTRLDPPPADPRCCHPSREGK
jgi:hypothetical protein